jgi:TnpA family transposase
MEFRIWCGPWDETVRVIASIHERIVSALLILHRLGSYARRNSVHQALAEIGRVHKTIHILRTLDQEEYRRRMGRELNKGETSHDLSRFLCFGKEGALRGGDASSAIRSTRSVQLFVGLAQRCRCLEYAAHRAYSRPAPR